MNTYPVSFLLDDALEQAIANPTASHRWCTLAALYAQETDSNQQAQIRSALTTHIRIHGAAGFFYAMFMADVTKDVQYSALAGQLLQEMEPFDVDRVMAFAVHKWARQVIGEGSRSQMVDALRAAKLPTSMQRIGVALPLPSRQPACGDAPVRTVAIVTPFISGLTHTPTVLVLQHARLLTDLGIAVQIFSAQELRVSHMADYLGNGNQLVSDAPDLDALGRLLPDGAALTICDDRFSVMRRCKDVLLKVAAFDPDMVLFVGLFSPLMVPLHAAWPVLGLCLHAVPPMAPVDAWLTADAARANGHSESWGSDIPPAWGIYYPFRIQLKPVSHPVTRVDLGLTAEQVVLISAGWRLPNEIAGQWAAAMLTLLQNNQNVTWLLVGGSGTLPPALHGISEPQIRLLSHQADLRSVLRCTDIYVNPQRMGGGFSVAEAMAEGLAVVALANADGGDKLGAAASPTLDAYFEQLQLLIDDAERRALLGATLKTRFDTSLDLDQAGPALLAACNTTLQRFQRRLAL